MKNKKLYIITIIFCFACIKLFAQNNNDSLIRSLEKSLFVEESTINNIITLNELSKLSIETSPEKAIEYAKQAIDSSLKEQNPYWTSESYRTCSKVEMALGNHTFAWNNLELAFQNDKKSKNTSSEFKTHLAIADFYSYLKKYDMAVNSLFRSLRILEKQVAGSKINQVHIKLGDTYEKAGDNFKCLEYYMKSLSYFNNTTDTIGLATINNKIGKVYQSLEKPDKAIAYLTKSINLARKSNNSDLTFDPSVSIGAIYLTEGKLNLARKVLNDLNEIQQRSGNQKNRSIVFQNIAILEDAEGNFRNATQYLDSAYQIEIELNNKSNQCRIAYNLGKTSFKSGDSFNSIKYLETAEELALAKNEKHCLALIYMLYSEIYEARNNFKMALKYSQLASFYNDSIASIELENSKLTMKSNLVIEEKQRENEILLIDNQVKSKEIEKGKDTTIYFFILIGTIIIIAIVTFLLFKEKIDNRIKLQSHRRLYDAALKKHKIVETKYEAVVEQSYDIIFIQKGNKIVFANKKAFRVSGYPENELYLKRISDFIHPEDFDRYKEFARQPLKIGETRNFINRIIDRYGNEFTFEIIGRKVLMNNEEVIISAGRDLTERIEAEEALNKSNQRNKNLIENSPSGILYINQNGDIVEMNPLATETLGYLGKELNGHQKYYDLFPEKDSKVTSNIKKCFEEGIVITDDCQFKNQRSEVMFVHFSLAPIKSTKGSVQSVIMNFNNITDKRKIEQDLSILQERYNLAFEGTQLGLWDWELSSDKMIYNDQFYWLLGYNRGEIAENRNSIVHLIYPDDRELVQEKLEEHLKGTSDSYEVEYKILTNDNKWKWVSDHGKVVLRDDNGHPIRLVGTIRDITARKNTEDKLLQSEKKYRSLIENMQDGVFIILEKTLVFVNHALARMTGYDYHELIGMNYSKLLNIQDSTMIDQNYNIIIDQTSSASFESSLLHKNGNIVLINISIGSIDYNGDRALHGTVKDITDKKRAERILKKSEKNLRIANATKDKFFSIIAHDLKNPFNAIMGFAHLLNEEYDGFGDDDRKRFIKNIWEAAENTYKLVENLLQWSRAQTGKIPFHADKIDLSTVANENISILKPNAERKGVKLFSEISFDSNVLGDINMLTTVIRNLLSNAIKFTNSGDKVVISCRFTENMAEVCVKDHGVGISKENQKKLFQFGEQYKTEGTSNERGTGLGLILCKEFIDRHKGKIWVESKPGEGSNFYFTVPCYND